MAPRSEEHLDYEVMGAPWGQNDRPGILQTECERDGRVRYDRMGGPLLGSIAAMQREHADPTDDDEDG